MKGFASNITLAPKVERPFPDKQIFWGSQNGRETVFPTIDDAKFRIGSGEPIPLKEFNKAVLNAQERIWIVDEYLLMPDNQNVEPSRRIEQILEWLPVWLIASDVRFLTKRHQEVGDSDLERFQQRAKEINDHRAKRIKDCCIEVRKHFKKNSNLIHDRFAIIDDELWHFGGTVGGFHSKVSAASRGWSAKDYGAISFFEDIWNAGVQI